jgi:hypothetical protein
VIGLLVDDQMPIAGLPGGVMEPDKYTGVTIQRLINPHLNGHTRLCCNHWL